MHNYFSNHVRVAEPDLNAPLSDFERTCKSLKDNHGLGGLSIDIHALQRLSKALRDGNWCITVSVWMGKEIIRVQKGKAGDSYGIAIDIGTTTVVGYLCNLKSMEVVDTIPLANP